MANSKSFERGLYTLSEDSFAETAMGLFQLQAENNRVYKAYLSYLGVEPGGIKDLNNIPFLPISFFKTQEIRTGDWIPQTRFRSSGTTGGSTSTHFVRDLSFYLRHAKKNFEFFFGPASGYHFFALLPSYLERKDSSLISMMDYLIRESGSPFSGFYLSDFGRLCADIKRAREDVTRKVLVWGVSFALIDLAEQLGPDLSGCLVFETGGMKGRRKEITRQELHESLKSAFNVPVVCSEYGMTELFSQAYMDGGVRFRNPPWVRVLAREIEDPFCIRPPGKAGGLNVIDLANTDTISFIETEDLGVCFDDGSFDVLGRLDNSDMRGCNLLLNE